MKNFLFFLLAFGMFAFASCGDDEADDGHMHGDEATDYHVHFITPAEDGSTEAMQGQTLAMEIEVEDHKGGTVHHVKVKITKKDDASVVLYEGPSDAHVHDESGAYVFKHDLILDANDVEGHSDWNVEVKAWGHEAGEGEVTSSTTFHVHPM